MTTKFSQRHRYDMTREPAEMSVHGVHTAYDDEIVFDALMLLASNRHPHNDDNPQRQ